MTVERYGFRHALIQEAAYDELLPSERRGSMPHMPRRSRAAPGGRRGGRRQPARAARPSLDGGPRAGPRLARCDRRRRCVAGRYAFAEAARQYERAIEAWDWCRRPTVRPTATWATSTTRRAPRDPRRRRVAGGRTRPARDRARRRRDPAPRHDCERRAPGAASDSGSRPGWPATRRRRSASWRRRSTCSRATSPPSADPGARSLPVWPPTSCWPAGPATRRRSPSGRSSRPGPSARRASRRGR